MTELAALVRDREVSPVDLVRRAVDRIERYPQLNAFRSLQLDGALRAARAAERRARSGEALGPLHGIPMAVKDNIDVLGVATTAGTAFHDPGPARRNAAIVDRLVGAGAIVLGKLHLAEWAIGGTTHNVHFGDGRNPWDGRRSPGGSSGGSAAAVAADLVAATIGTDTGGSLRIPAALTGTTTVRPTVGAVSTRGVIPVSWTLDTAGPIARRVADVAAVFAAIAGFDAHDPSSRRASPTRGRERDLHIGVVPGDEAGAVHPGVRSAVERALETFAGLGASVEEVALPGLRAATESAKTILLAEAAAVHAARLASHPEQYATDVLQRLRVGAAVTGSDYALARHVGRAWRRELDELFERYDVLVGPACGVVAPILEGTDPRQASAELMQLAVGFSLARVPILVMPCGFVDGLPVALQLVGREWSEGELFRIGDAFQRATDWHLRRPSLADFEPQGAAPVG